VNEPKFPTIPSNQDSRELISNAKLSTEEKARYQELLEQADRSISKWAKAVEEIRDRKLYREEFGTFEEFCREKLQKSRAHVYRILAAEDVKKDLLDRNSLGENKNLSPIGDKTGSENLVPTNEAQARELAKAPEDQRQAIMREVTQDGTVEPTARSIKLAVAKQNLQNNTQLRDAINQIARHGGEELFEEILLGEITISTTQIYALAKHSPEDIAALGPRILEAKRFPLTPPGSDAPPQTREEILRRYLAPIAEFCGEGFTRELKDGALLPEASEVAFFVKLKPTERGELAPYVLPHSTFQEALDRQAEAHQEKLKTKLQNKLRALFLRDVSKWINDQGEIDRYKDALCKAVDKATYEQLTEFAEFSPETETDIDLEQIDPLSIKEAIMVCHERNKGNASHQEDEISFKDILAARANSTPVSQTPGSCKDKEPLSEDGIAAVQRLSAVLGKDMANPYEYFSKYSERDLVEWAFPESVLRTRQIRLSRTATESLHQTIQKVDTERMTALNIHDLAAWKSSTSGPEEFYIRVPSGLLFTLRIESPTGVLSELTKRDKERFLSIEEAIRRYPREHGHLLGAGPAPEATPSETEAEISFEEPAL
jgi:hypothetical protein